MRATRVRRRQSAVLAAAVAALCLSFAPEARADAQADYEKARAAFRAHAYEDAEARFSALLDPKAPEKLEPALASQARMYLGATYLLEKRKADAEHVFESLLIADPGFDPDPLTFPTDVLNTFIDTRAHIRQRLNDQAALQARLDAEKRAKEELEKKRQAERIRILEQMAAEEKITVRHSRLVASMPFGAGQFQNGQSTLGWIFLGVESALVIGTAITYPIYSYALDRRNEEFNAHDPDHKMSAYQDRAVTAQIVNLSLVGGLALVMAGGILQANLAFVPESPEMKTRPIPQATNSLAAPAPVPAPVPAAKPTLHPFFTVGPAPGGTGIQSGALGVRGTF